MVNNSSHSRFIGVTAKLLMVLLAVSLIFTAAPFVAPSAFPVANAAAVTYSVPSTATVADINSQLNTYASGTVVNMILGGNLDFTADGGTTGSEIIGINIPEGLTVNLYMNGKTLKFERSSDGFWQVPGIYAIVNHGTLNVYSGSLSTPNLVVGASSILINNTRTGVDCDARPEWSYCNVEGIRNYGSVTVNKSVNIDLTSYLTYDDGGNSKNYSFVNVAATGINNIGESSSATLNNGSISCYTKAFCINGNYNLSTTCKAGAARALSYGIYGGSITVNGAANLNVTADMGATDDGDWANDFGRARIISVAFGVASDGNIRVNGGTFEYKSTATHDHDGMKNGVTWAYIGGIAYKTALPTVTDCDIKVTTDWVDKIGASNDVVYTFEAPIAKLPVFPVSGDTLCNDSLFYSESKPDSYYIPYEYYLTGANAAGQYYDESGNTYTTEASTTDGTHPKPIVRGALEGYYRVHVVYRYWTSNTKNSVDTSVVGNEGNIGYSYKPIGDGTNVVNNTVMFNGLLSSSNLLKTAASGISYNSGGQSKNDYYWKQFNLASATTSAWFSDYNVASSSNRGTVFKSFVDATTGTVGAGSASPIYIFVDYYRVDPYDVVASVGAGGTATVTYTGDPIKASACGLTLKDGVSAEDYTSQYNIDFTNSSKITVAYSWTGINAAGREESGTHELPANAGTYTVTLSIADDTVYDPNNCDPTVHKNRRAVEYTFTLVIEQASVSRGTLPTAVNLIYGQKLNEVMSVDTYGAVGVKNEAVPGSFSFSNSADGSAYKNVGTANTSMTWTPTYAAGATAKNYKVTTFSVSYTVTPAAIVISPNGAAVTYGNSSFDVPFSITVTGLVANDDTDSVKTDIANAVNYMIKVNDSYVAYSPDDVGAGIYDIRARVNTLTAPAVLRNYTYSYADITEGYEVNTLTVAKRGLTVQASAVSRAYSPDDYTVSVSYTIIDGKYGVDDVRIPVGSGALSDNTAGTKEVSGVTKASALSLMTGGAAANYTVSELTYVTGDTLLVEITKAVPSVAAPTASEVFYRRTATLADITLISGATSVPGTWQWADPTVNPTVAVSSYNAKFVPDDSVNYDVKVVAVALTVKPSTVTVTYSGTVEYGDPVPNITAYTYSSVQDPEFSISAVTTTGNITPTTSYTQGAAVSSDGYPVTISAPNYKDAAGNYTFVAESGKITVVPRNIEFTVRNASIVYGDNFTASASTVELVYDESRLVGSDTIAAVTSNGTEPTFSYTTTFRYQDNYRVGTYEIKATPAFNTSANYTVSVINGVLSVTKAPLTIRANTVTLPYNSDVPADLASAYTFVGAKRNEGLSAIVSSGEIRVDTNYEKGSPVNSEGYPVIVDISDAVFDNYSVSVENGKINVVKATPEITAYPTATVTFGQPLADAVFTGAVITGDIAGRFVYGSASTVPAYSPDPYTIYTATFVPDDTNNYNSVLNLYIPLTVNKMQVTGALAVSGIPMKGETLSVDVSGLDPNDPGVYSYEWVIDGSSVGTGMTLVLGDAHIGKAVTVTATAHGQYEGVVTYVTTKIAPELTPVADILDSAHFNLSGLDAFGDTRSVVYNAESCPVSISLKDSVLSTAVVGVITVKYNGSTSVPKNVGRYNVTVDIATPDLSRVNEAGVVTYSPASNLSIGILEITKAPYDVTVTIADKVYDGFNTAFASDVVQTGAVTLPGGTSDDVSFDSANAVYTFSDANVGTGKTVALGTIGLTGSAKANYELNVTLANGGKADITPRTLKVSVEPIAREYRENYYDVDLAFIVDVSSIAPADTSSSVYVNEALASGKVDDYHAGTRRVTVTGAVLAGAKSANYVLELTNISGLTVNIEKAIPSYPLPYTGIVYYDSGRTLSNISLGDSRWAWADSVANEKPSAGTHVYKAVYTPDDTANYAAVEYDVSLEIRKAPVVVRSASFTVIYGEYEPTYYYTVSGLTGADTVSALGGFIIQNCSYVPGSDVGNYDIVFDGGFTSSDYTFTYEKGCVTVAPRAAYVTATAQSREYEEGNLNVTVTFSALSNIFAADGTNVTLSANSVVGQIANANAGVKSVNFAVPSLSGSKAGNYTLTLLNPDVKVEIAKAHIAGVTLPISGTLTYGHRLGETEFTSPVTGTEYGTFVMEDASATPSAVGVTTDVYRVMFIPFNTANFATESAFIRLTVTKADLAVELSLVGNNEVNKKLYVVSGAVPGDAEQWIIYKWYRIDSADADIREGVLVASDAGEYALKEADVGKYIVCVATNLSNSPYNVSGRVASDDTVQQSSENMSFWHRIVAWFYKVISSITQLFGRIKG